MTTPKKQWVKPEVVKVSLKVVTLGSQDAGIDACNLRGLQISSGCV